MCMNIYEKRSKNSYDKKAENYDSTFDGKFTVKFKRMMCESVCVNANDTVVDVACGNGRLLHMLTEKNSFYGYGVDISEKMIEQAKKLNPTMNFYVAGCEALPFENGEISPPLVKNTHFIIGGADPLLRHVYNLNPNPVLPSLLHLTHSVAMHFHPS